MKKKTVDPSSFRTRALISNPQYKTSHNELLQKAGIKPSKERLKTKTLANGRIVIVKEERD